MVIHDASNEWVREQRAAWSALAGSTIRQWAGMDYGVGDDDDAPVFLERTAPFHQLEHLRVVTDAGSALDFGNYQNDDIFGLSLRSSEGKVGRDSPWNREANLTDLPTGRVQKLEVHVDARDESEGDVIEAELTVDGRTVLIVAAEVFDNWKDQRFVWGDESLFVFTDPDAARRTLWAGPRLFTIVDLGS